MLLTEIDHVAIAVRDLEAAIDYYERAFGATVTHRELVEHDGVEEALLAVGHSYIQLTTATRDDSPVAKFMAKRGEGIHHVGYRVDDCDAALRVDGRRRRHRRRRRAPTRQPWDHRRLHPPQGQLRHADRARPGVSASARRGPRAAERRPRPRRRPSCGTWTARSSTPSRTGWSPSTSSSPSSAATGPTDDARSIIGFDLLDGAAVLRERGGVDLEPRGDRRAAARRRHRPRPDPRAVAAGRPPAALRAARRRRAVRARHDVVPPAGRRRRRGAGPDPVRRHRSPATRSPTASRTPSRTSAPRPPSAATRWSAWRSRTRRPVSPRPAPPAAWWSPCPTSSPSSLRPAGPSSPR